MSTLYRKYRPQLFADIHDQEHIVKTITNEIATAKIAHAYLFTGPRGVGKTTIARLLAKALNCKSRKIGEFEPCDKCSSCTEISAGHNIDVIEIDAASHTGVDNVRENIIENAQFKPTQSQYKIFIIDEVHMLSTSAFNALLKTIEEPPAHVVFILATTELQKLPATIISRCQRFAFKKITRAAMLKKMEGICKEEKIKVSKSVLEKIIDKSEGGMRDAESLLGQILSLNLKEIDDADIVAILPSTDLGTAILVAEFLANKETAKALEKINELAEGGTNLEQFTLDLIEILRATLIAQNGFDIKNIINIDEDALKQIKKLSQDFNGQLLLAMIDSLIIRKREIKQAPIPQLPLELFVIQFASKNSFVPTTPTAPIITETKIIEKKTPQPIENKNISAAVTTEEIKPKTFTESVKAVIGGITGKTQISSTLEEIKTKWPEIVSNISKTNASLTFILKMCTLTAVDEYGLLMTLAFDIHKEKVEEMKNKKVLEDELERIMGERIKVNCELKSETPVVEDNGELTNLAAEFGGEVL